MTGDGRRNVVLVTVDSLRADHCGFVGYDHDVTPTLDELAADGVAFENAIAPGPSTYDAMPAVFTGQPVVPHAVHRDIKGDTLDRRTRNIALNMRGETIAEWFDRQGYATGAFTTNPYTGTHTAFARGFDRFEDFMGGGEGALMRTAAHVPVLSELKHLVTLVRGDRASMRWTDYYDEIVEWARSAPEPYFLWVFLLDTHTPYLVDEPFRERSNRAGMYYHNWRLWMAKKWLDGDGDSLDRDRLVDLYDDATRSVDAFLGRLLDDLGGTDPAVVVHADHGEAFGEHGTYGHQATLYEENVHVPLVARGASADDGGATSSATGAVETPVSLTQVPAIVRAVANGVDPGEAAVEGTAGRRAGTVIANTWDGAKVAVRTTARKYVATLGPGTADIQHEEVYDLRSDPAERENVVADHEAFASSCRELVRRRVSHGREAAALSSAAEPVSDGKRPRQEVSVRGE